MSVANIRHVLLDIEGTTCPVNFVADVLFPYASEQLLPYLNKHVSEETIQRLLAEIDSSWKSETDSEAIALLRSVSELREQAGREAMAQIKPEEACLYLWWLIRQDRKLTALKDLQGLIWEEGYQQGRLIAPLFKDVPDALKRWRAKGIQLSVYSSGSIQAQKLLYGHTVFGDLTYLFSDWFDTRTGAKNEASSYRLIANQLNTTPEAILFISDAPAELSAAKEAKMTVLFSQRAGNPHQDSKDFPVIENFSEINLG